MNHIDINHERDIREALHHWVGGAPCEIKRSLTQGASAAIYEVHCDGQPMIARISDPNRPNANVPMEIHCMVQASKSGVAPPIYY